MKGLIDSGCHESFVNIKLYFKMFEHFQNILYIKIDSY